MAKTQTFWNGLIEHYTDFTDFQYFECPSCGKGNKRWPEIIHNQDCEWVKKQRKAEKENNRINNIKKRAPSKLTKEEKESLGY